MLSCDYITCYVAVAFVIYTLSGDTPQVYYWNNHDELHHATGSLTL